jgi:hypothetical protein
VQAFRRHTAFLQVALVAFLVQTFFALAHVHAPGGLKAPAQIAGAGTCSEKSAAACGVPSPADDDAHCQLCAALHAAQAVVLPAAAGVAPPVVAAATRPRLGELSASPASRGSPFQARAPPVLAHS